MRCRTSGPAAQKSSRPDLQHAHVRRERRGERARRASASDTSSATIRGFSGRGITRSPDPRRTRRHAEPTAQVRGGREPLLLEVVRRCRARSRREPTGRSRSRSPPAPPTRRPAASRPRPSRIAHRPRAMIGVSGSARETSNTARIVNGFSAGPESQPVTGPSVGRSVSASIAHRRRGVHEGEPVRSRAHDAAGELDDVEAWPRGASRTPGSSTCGPPPRRSPPRGRRARRGRAARAPRRAPTGAPRWPRLRAGPAARS